MKSHFLLFEEISVSFKDADRKNRHLLGAITAASSGRNPSINDVGIGASIGLGIGLIASYFVQQHFAVERDEKTQGRGLKILANGLQAKSQALLTGWRSSSCGPKPMTSGPREFSSK